MMTLFNDTHKSTRRLLQFLALGILAGSGIWIYLVSRIEYPPVIRFGDGSPGGRYAALNAALYPRLARSLKEKFGTHLELVHSQGSLENLSKVASGDLHLAFYQEGVGHSDQIRSVINLEFEFVYLIVKNRAHITSFSDLKGKRINLGPKGSGTYILSRQILDYYPLTDFEERNYTFEEAVSRFDRELDAAFFVAALQAPVLTQLLQTGTCRMLPLTFGPAMRLTHNWITEQTIPTMAFQRVPEPVPDRDTATLAVKSSIIAGQQIPAPIVETVVQTVLESPFVQENNLLFLRNNQKTGFAQTDAQFRLHDGAQAYYFPWQPTIPSDFVESWNGIIGFLVLLMSGIYTVVIQLRQRREEQRHREETAKKNALDVYIQKIENICDRVVKASTREELIALRRDLNLINLQASVDYREEKFRSSDDFVAFTTQVSFVLAQTVAKLQEIGDSSGK